MVEYKNYKREITHTEYTFMNDAARQVGIVNKLDKLITDNKWHITKNNFANTFDFNYTNSKCIKIITDQNSLPLVGSIFFGFLLILSIVGAFKFPKNINSFFFLGWITFVFVGLFFFSYYFLTKPTKEKILNREDGLFTFPGFMWYKNITMSINVVEFAFSQPSAQGLGAYELRVVRPDKMFSQAIMTFGGTCYEDLSLILWYMDKNRPLPPGDAFDEYRDQDFERRKAAGFPQPLFPSTFETPEATPEQQAERLMIGRW